MASTTKTTKSTAKPRKKAPAAKAVKKVDAPADVPAPIAPPTPIAEPTVVVPAEPVVSAGEMRKPDLIKSVVARTGAKPRDVKPIVDAVLATMGEAVAEGQDLTLPPMGKLKLQRVKDMEKARVTVAKLRQPKV